MPVLMRVGTREALLLDFLFGKPRGAGVSEIARALGLRVSNAGKYVKKLAEIGLVSAHRAGRQKSVVLDSALESWFYAVKRSFPSLGFADFFSGGMPLALAFAKGREFFSARDLGIPIASAKRVLKKLRGLGLVFMRKKGEYVLRPQALSVAELCENAVGKMLLHRAKKELGAVEFGVFSFGSAGDVDAVFAATQKTSKKGFWPAGLSAFHNYGLPLVSAGRFYYSYKKPGLEAAAMHALAVSRDVRTVLYACALLLKNKRDPRFLLAKKQRFGVKPEFLESLAEFMESKGKKTFPGFPSFEEVEELAKK